MSERVQIYTDGACSGNPGPGGWGVVLRFGEHERELKGGEAQTTNNRMELMAAIEALNALKRPCTIDLFTDSVYVRDWLYVEDHAEALLLVVEKGRVGRSYNIGGENERSNLELVKTLCAILDDLRPRSAGSYADQITFVTDRPGHDARYAIDPSRIRQELGWRPSVTVEEGLKRTVQWYLDNEAWWRALQDRAGVGERLGVKT